MAFLIAGLGNPGKAYEKTRHNIGFRAVEAIAKKNAIDFRRKLFLKGRVAHGVVGDKQLYLLEPETYMNLSGLLVAKMMKRHSIALERLLVIVDDVALPFGQIRLRSSSGSGGHNGLKSVEESLGTNAYARLRIGVGDRTEGDLASYVLARFTPSEEKLIPEVLERVAEVADVWLTEGLTSAMNRANQTNSRALE